ILAAPAARAQSTMMADTTHHAKPAMAPAHPRRMAGSHSGAQGGMMADTGMKKHDQMMEPSTPAASGQMMADTGMKKHDQMMEPSTPASSGQMGGSMSSGQGRMMGDSTMKPHAPMMADSMAHAKPKAKHRRSAPAMNH
ncbi:MAG: hypothetical protein JF590_00700, partial [Gemmatimonadetes bacterium]|nr:hypothetical protein [Gemmatimonadota bacterium]